MIQYAVYYNEIDPTVIAWLRELMNHNLIPPGTIDTRSICDVDPRDLDGFTHCHFFAGIGGWAQALRLANWPLDRPVWTGSCPCQPFSTAGKQLGVKDPRHLWPEFRRLITNRSPAVVFGEQVAAKAGREWLSGVRADLEELGYAVGAADLCAAGAGSPQIRQRLYWVADSHCQGFAYPTRRERPPKQAGRKVFVAHTFAGGIRRRVSESGFRPVVDGLSAIPFAVRAYGNAIVPQCAASFIEAYKETMRIK